VIHLVVSYDASKKTKPLFSFEDKKKEDKKKE